MHGVAAEAIERLRAAALADICANGDNPAMFDEFVNSGNFTLSGQWYDGDPFNGGNLIADATDTLLPYSATVTGTSSVPEPSSFLLLVSGIVAIIGWRKVRSRPRIAVDNRSN